MATSKGSDPGDLADLISRLWWRGQKSGPGRVVRTTTQAACQETPQPLACDLQQWWQEEIIRLDQQSQE